MYVAVVPSEWEAIGGAFRNWSALICGGPFQGARFADATAPGDLVALGATGSWVCGARVDEQVKIRGYRIELGEIQPALARGGQGGNRGGDAREDRPGDKRLVGYVTESRCGAVDPGGLRAEMAQAATRVTVPAAVVVLEALPLTVNGNRTRGPCPAPEPGSDRYRTPGSAVEVRSRPVSTPMCWGCRGSGVDDCSSTWVATAVGYTGDRRDQRR